MNSKNIYIYCVKKVLYIIIVLVAFLHLNNVGESAIAIEQASNLSTEHTAFSQKNIATNLETPIVTSTISTLDFSIESIDFSQIFTLKTNSSAHFYNVYVERFLQHSFKQYNVYWVNLLINNCKTVLLFPFHSFL